MQVKYIGKAQMIISEYDGKRYVFSKKNPITDIPVKVYNYIQASRGMYSGDIIPYIPANAAPLEVMIKNEPESNPIIKHKPAKGKKK